MYSATIAGASIVLIGSFNPDVITAGWLLYHKIIDNESLDDSNPGANIPFELSRVNLKECNIFTEKNRIIISTTSAPYTFISDLTLNILNLLKNSCVVEKIGFNYQEHYSFDAKTREKLGIALAPRNCWGPWGEKLHNTDMSNPTSGLMSISMKQGNLSDRVEGSINVTVGISELIEAAVSFKVNDHFDLYKDDEDEVEKSVKKGGKALKDRKSTPKTDGVIKAVELIIARHLSSIDGSRKIIGGIIEGSLNV